MLRYRSYPVDFLTKPKEFLEDPEINSVKNLMDVGLDDAKSELTLDLFQFAFAKLQKGLEEEHYFEVICICQSIMNERFGKLLQEFQGIEDKFKLITDLEETITNLLSYMELQGQIINPALSELFADISTGQKGNRWIDRRDTSIHEYVAVFSDNIQFTMTMRDGFNRRTAELGVQLTLKTVNLVNELILQTDKTEGL